MKNYSTQIIDALKNGNPRTELFEFQFSSGTVRITTAGHDIVHNGQTYTAGGIVLDTGSVSVEKELRINTVDIVIGAVDQTMLALIQNANQQNRKVVFTQIVLDNNNQSLGEIFKSLMVISQYSVQDEDDEATIALSCTNILSDFNTIRGVRTTQSSFQRFYPTSTSFINSKDIGDDLKWGSK